MVNVLNKNTIRVAEVCFKKFIGKPRRSYPQLEKIRKEVQDKGKYSIENFEAYENNVRLAILSFYKNKIKNDTNTYKQLNSIQQEIEHLKEDGYMDVYEKLIDLISEHTYAINKQKYLLRKKAWMDKGSLCCACKYPLPSENYIKYDYQTKLWYCPYCFKHLDELDKLEKRKTKVQLARGKF